MARADAKLKTLPEEIQAEMWRMLTTPVDSEGRPCAPKDGSAMTAEQILAWLADVHEVSSSTGAFSEWRRWYATQRTVGNTKQQTLDLMEALKSQHPEASAEDVMEMGRLWFSLRSMEEGDAKVFEKMFRLRLAEKASQVDERKLALLEEKAARFDAAKEAAEAGDDLTPEQRLQKIREGLKI